MTMFAYHKPDDAHMFDVNPAWWDTRPPTNSRRRTGTDGKEYRPDAGVWARRRFGVEPGDMDDDRAMNAQMRSLVNSHKSKADPGTSEKLGPNMALAYWLGFASSTVLIAGVTALAALTGVVLR